LEKLNKSREAVKRKDGGEAAEKYIKYGIIGFIVVAVIALGVALFLTFNRPVVATVGNEKITVEEFKFFLKQQKDNMLYLAGKGTLPECEAMSREALVSGRAMEKLKTMVAAQKGDFSVLEDTTKFAVASIIHEVKAPASGYITAMDTEECGIASVVLGAGRESKEDPIDYSAGIMLRKKTGEWVQKGETLAELHTNDPQSLAAAEEKLLAAIEPGIPTVILPEENRSDVEHLPDYMRDRVKTVFVSDIKQVLDVALMD